MILRFRRVVHGVAQVVGKMGLPAVGFAVVLGAPLYVLAQTTEIPPPQVYPTQDANGVDLATGAFSYTLPTLSIGPVGAGGMELKGEAQTLYDAEGLSSTWRDNWAGMIVGQAIIGKKDLDPRYLMVTIMGDTIVFRKTGPFTTNVFVPAQGDNASLTLSGSTYTLTLSDGTKAYYDKGLATRYPFVADEGLISSIVRANGEVINFYYEAADPPPSGLILPPRRIMSINSSYGYQIKYLYASDNPSQSSWQRVSSIKMLNNKVESCAPLAHVCSTAATWPSYTLTSNGSEVYVTDSLSRQTRITVVPNVGMRIRKPGSTGADDIVATGQTVGSGVNRAFRTTSVVIGGKTWAYAYGPRPVTDPATSFYDYTVTATDPLSHSRVYTFRSYPDQGLRVTRIKEVKDALLHTKTFDYDPDTYRLNLVQEPEGNSVAYEYDERGNIKTVTKTPKPGLGGAVSMTATYPATCSDTAQGETNFRVCNKPKTITDFRQKTTNITYYSEHGGVNTITSPAPSAGADRPETRTTYLPLSAYYKRDGATSVQAADAPIYVPATVSQCVAGAACTGGADELLEERIYTRATLGQANNLQPDRVRKKAGNGVDEIATNYEYSDAGDVLNLTDPLGRQSHFEYDAMRQRTGSVTPDPDGGQSLKPRAQWIQYNGDGRVTSIKTGTVAVWNASPTTLSELKDERTHYDSLGRKDQTWMIVSQAIQSLTEYAYDNANRLVCTAVRMNKAAFSETPFDACAERDAGLEGRDRITKIDYDEADRMTSITSGYLVEPLVERSITYTANDKVQSDTDGENNTTNYEYDGFDRLKKVVYPKPDKDPNLRGPNPNDYDEYDYDENDNRTYWRRRESQTLSAVRSISTQYDFLNRPIVRTVSASADVAGTTTYNDGYDNLGRLTSASEGGRTVEKRYDVHGRLKKETMKTSGVRRQKF